MGVNPRVEIEQGVVGLLQPLKAGKKLRWVEAIGGLDYDRMLRAALGAPPFALVKYTGSSRELTGGGIVQFEADVSLLIGVKSFKSLTAQRMQIYDLLDEIEGVLAGLRLESAAGSDVYWPLVPLIEQWSEMSGGDIEVWEQIYRTQWRQDFGRP